MDYHTPINGLARMRRKEITHDAMQRSARLKEQYTGFTQVHEDRVDGRCYNHKSFEMMSARQICKQTDVLLCISMHSGTWSL